MAGARRMRSGIRWSALALAWGLAAAGPAAAGTAELTVQRPPQQTFEGFGFSFEPNNPYATLSEAQKAEVDQLLFTDLNTRIVRLWYAIGDPKLLRDDYLARGIIPRALANGVTEVLVAQGAGYLGDPDVHARQIADDIAVMRDEYGIGITATGVLNEPSGEGRSFIPPSHYVPLAIAMRRELEARGLSDVTILGPEWPNADRGARQWLDAVESDPVALASFDALSTHSYNMAATPEFSKRAQSHGKQYWMTEAGAPIQDGSAEFDYAFGASVSSRFLNDLNNGVTHWVWFIGLSHTNRDVWQKLVMCEGLCDGTQRIYKNYAYHHVQQITSSFLPGTSMRHVTSDLPGWEHMTWTYGPKPPLHAAAGVRSDGRWALAVVNDTQGDVRTHASWDPPEDYTITFNVLGLAEVPRLVFDLCRTNIRVAKQCGETIELINGRATFDVASLELITLVARTPPAEPAPSTQR
jgi:hypothetical protein